MPNLWRLIAVFEETRELLADPGNDFAWSAWAGREDALGELDGIISSLRCGVLPESLSMEVLYAPTGPIQEVSLSSGWGKAFLALAERFDRETEYLQKQVVQNAGDFQIDETAKQILVLLNGESEYLSVSDLAPKLQMTLNPFTYYIKELKKLDYVYSFDSYEDRESSVVEDIYYHINQKGRAYLKKNGLL